MDSSDDSPFRELFARATIADLLLVLSVPVVLVAAASLPLAARRSLVFEYGAPTLRTAVLSTFVHLGPTHLAVNVVGYALVVPLAYLLSVVNGQRRRFRITFVSVLLVCPVVLSYLNLAIVRTGGSVGFSGVLMALYGYLPLAIALHAETTFGIGRERRTAPLLFFLGLTLISVLTLGAVLTYGVTVPFRGRTVPVTDVLVATLVGLIAALALTVTWYALSAAGGRPALWATVRDAASRQGHFELGVAATVLFLALPLATFPVDPVVDGSVLNLYVHLLGYALGFIGSYATTVVEAALFRQV
jgi:hypothetical protein